MRDTIHSGPDGMASYVDCPRVTRIGFAIAVTVCIGQTVMAMVTSQSGGSILQWAYALALWAATIAAARGYAQSRPALLSMGLFPLLSIIDGIRAGIVYAGSFAWVDIAIDAARFIPLCAAAMLLFVPQSTRWFSWQDESRKVAYKRRT
jgi:hypothetical protein